MMKAAVPIAMLVLGSSQQPQPAAQNSATLAEGAIPAQPVNSTAQPYALDEKNELIEFHFGWSAEAAAVPELAKRFRAEMAKARTELVTWAKDDKKFRDKQGYDFHGYMSSTDYETAGQSRRLLSLKVEAGSFTGGAHGNHGTAALIWDRLAKTEIANRDLFGDTANRDRLLTQRWCDALNVAREEKRGEPVRGGGMFDECPSLDEVAIIPADKDEDARFERLLLVASPYVAGPYAEGSYEIDLAITADLIAALKSEFRDSFEAAQVQ